MVTKSWFGVAAFAAGLSIATAASAQQETTVPRDAAGDGAAPSAVIPAAAATAATTTTTKASVPALHHAPRTTVFVGEDVKIGAVIDRPDRLKRALLVYRANEAAAEIEFARSSDDDLPYVAVIPAAAVQTRGLGYAIELETTDGARVPVFASRAAPFAVTVLDSPANAREAALLARLEGRRSVVQAGGEYVQFGTSRANVPVAGENGTPTRVEERRVRDQYYRVEGSYTYRLLGVVSEFGIRAGAVRGQSLVVGETDPSKYDVGLNYGAPRIRLRADDWVHFEAELLTSVTEVGFATGGSGAVLLGDPYGSKLTFGLESIAVFGTRGYSRLDVVASKRFSVAPIIEVSNMPHADRAGVRLLAEAGVGLGNGFRVDVRGGYQARSFDQGGPTLGSGLAYAF